MDSGDKVNRERSEYTGYPPRRPPNIKESEDAIAEAVRTANDPKSPQTKDNENEDPANTTPNTKEPQQRGTCNTCQAMGDEIQSQGEQEGRECRYNPPVIVEGASYWPGVKTTDWCMKHTPVEDCNNNVTCNTDETVGGGAGSRECVEPISKPEPAHRGSACEHEWDRIHLPPRPSTCIKCGARA